MSESEKEAKNDFSDPSGTACEKWKLFFKGATSSFDEYSWYGLALLPTNGLRPCLGPLSVSKYDCSLHVVMVVLKDFDVDTRKPTRQSSSQPTRRHEE